MKGKLISRLVSWFVTGVMLIIVFVLLGIVIDNLRVVLNVIIFFLVVIFLGAVVYEGLNYIYKKWQKIKNKE